MVDVHLIGSVHHRNSFPKATVTDNVDTNLVATNDCKSVNKHTLGLYTCTYKSHDHAGSFGLKGKDNEANNGLGQTVKITVVDTTPPVITRRGQDQTVECSHGYKDAGATMVDSHDSAVCKDGKYQGTRKWILAKRIKTVNPVNTMKVGTYTVTYDGTDFQGLAAKQVLRTVTVKDVTKPVLTVCTGGAHEWMRTKNQLNEQRTKTYTVKAGEHARAHGKTFKKGAGCLDHHIIQHSAGYTKVRSLRSG